MPSVPSGRSGRGSSCLDFSPEALRLHLAEISRHVAPEAHAIVVLDGAGWHAAHDLAVPDNLTLLPLPAYFPELNPVENVWQYLRQNQLSLRVWPDYDAIIETCCRAVATRGACPQAGIAGLGGKRPPLERTAG